MHCNSCVENIEKKISTLSGVVDIDVSLEEKEGKVTYLPKHTTGKTLENAIDEMGFEAKLKRIVEVLTQTEIPLLEGREADNKEAENNHNDISADVTRITVKGMTCQSCVKTIESCVSKLSGVQDVKVSLEDGEAVIKYNPTLADPGMLREAIDDAGFEASLPSALSSPTNEVQTVTINVEGMTCNSCVKTIEQNINLHTGVHSVVVSLDDKMAKVCYAPAKVTAEQLRDAIDDMGFDAQVAGDDICKGNKDIHTAMISVEGMTCMSCVKTIEGTMSNKPGIKSIRVSLSDRQAVIEYDEALTTPEDLRAGIEEMGFDAFLPEGMFLVMFSQQISIIRI